MSLNEIYDDQVTSAVKTWQNYRFNNINIRENFNVNTTGASIGDVLQLDGTLQPTWVPYTNSGINLVENVLCSFSATTIGVTEAILPFTSVSGVNPLFTLDSGSLLIGSDCALMISCHFTSTPISASMPVFSLQKISGIISTILCNVSPYRTTVSTDTPKVSCTCLVPVKCLAGDRIIVATVGTSGSSFVSCAFDSTQSAVSVIRLN